MIEVHISDIPDMEREYRFFKTGNSGSFTTHLFNALQVADNKNFARLAEAFPAHAYTVAMEQSKHFLHMVHVKITGTDSTT